MAIWGAALAGSPEVTAAEETPSVQHGVTSRTSWAKFAARVTEGVRSVYGLTLTGAASCPRVLRVTGHLVEADCRSEGCPPAASAAWVGVTENQPEGERRRRGSRRCCCYYHYHYYYYCYYFACRVAFLNAISHGEMALGVVAKGQALHKWRRRPQTWPGAGAGAGRPPVSAVGSRAPPGGLGLQKRPGGSRLRGWGRTPMPLRKAPLWAASTPQRGSGGPSVGQGEAGSVTREHAAWQLTPARFSPTPTDPPPPLLTGRALAGPPCFPRTSGDIFGLPHPGERVLLASSGYSAGWLLDTPRCTGQPPTGHYPTPRTAPAPRGTKSD